MTGTDHYDEAERLLRGAEAAHSPESWDTFMRAAQVHATLATVQRGVSVGTLSVDLAPAETPGYLSIPWPPSDELVERVARVLSTRFSSETDGWPVYAADARAVLDTIGGAGDGR